MPVACLIFAFPGGLARVVSIRHARNLFDRSPIKIIHSGPSEARTDITILGNTFVGTIESAWVSKKTGLAPLCPARINAILEFEEFMFDLSFGRRLLLGTSCLLALPPFPAFSANRESLTHAAYQADKGEKSLPRFEVAAIRPDRSNDLVMSFWFTPDGVNIKGFTLQAILHTAFLGMHEYGDDRVLGLPGWVRTEKYDIQAKVDQEDVARWKKLPVDQQRLVLLSLLGERFNMKFHRASRISSVYVLSAIKGGPRLKESKTPTDRGPHMFNPLEPGNMESHSTYMWQLVDELERQLNCIVEDDTGLNSTYDYKLEWTPDDRASPDSSGPSLSTALKEQLGLKLEMRKRPVEVVVIDHIERPSPN
jgi:uncharacterized protein (TIGR03435 family)